MFSNNYPYTDFHELNLDWFLNEFKQVHNHVDTLDATVTEFTNFVTNYFDNLDVQEEINEKLDALVADGTISALLLPLTTDAVSDWLTEHLTPTTPVVDNTLTIAGAAADAKVTGDLFKTTILIHGTYTGNDVNDISDNSIYYVASSVSHLPNTRSAFIVETVAATSGTLIQKATGWSGINEGITYTRRYVSGSWTDWVTYDTSLIFVNGSYTGNDVNDISDNSIYYVASSVSHLPNTRSAFIVETVAATSGALIQKATGWSGINEGITYTRRYVSGSWTDWVTYDIYHANSSKPIYYAFGDSLTWGAKWVPTDTDPYYEVIQIDSKYRMPTRIANAIGSLTFYNKGVGGSTLSSEYNTIQNTDMTDANLITIAGGRNDSSTQLGSVASVSGDGTICGTVRQIIEYVQTNYPKAQIVWIGVTPNTLINDNSKVFTAVYSGGWSLNTYDQAVSAVCAEYCVPYVNWRDCSYMMHWADFTGAGNNYAHPNNDESYVQMGNYIAGQVAKYYQG